MGPAKTYSTPSTKPSLIKVLHIYRGYGKGLKNTVVDNQIATLKGISGFKIETYVLRKGGIEYLRSIIKVRSFVKKQKIDIIHAHYSFSGFVAGLAFTGRPVICSLMGSDVFAKAIERTITTVFRKFFWKVTIVKSKEMQKLVPHSKLVPNGVDMRNFRTIERDEAIKKVGFDGSKINILFVATMPDIPVKNLQLAQKAIRFLNNESKDNKYILHILSDVDYKDLPYYYNGANMLIMTSVSEGSPNVIKEAMACNCPIVATDVGDIRELTLGVSACNIVKYEIEDVAKAIKDVVSYNKRSNGRAKIQHLSSERIANEILKTYSLSHKKSVG